MPWCVGSAAALWLMTAQSIVGSRISPNCKCDPGAQRAAHVRESGYTSDSANDQFRWEIVWEQAKSLPCWNGTAGSAMRVPVRRLKRNTVQCAGKLMYLPRRG